jgi:hypothetical protein
VLLPQVWQLPFVASCSSCMPLHRLALSQASAQSSGASLPAKSRDEVAWVDTSCAVLIIKPKCVVGSLLSYIQSCNQARMSDSLHIVHLCRLVHKCIR